MFGQYTVLMMLILNQLNAMTIMYELLGRKKKYAVSSYIWLKKKMDSKAKVPKKASST